MISKAPQTLASYAEFYSPNAKAYRCACPHGFSDDECKDCSNTTDGYSFKNIENECTECDCSALSTSEQCNSITGQCLCPNSTETGDVHEYGGRRCVSIV